MLSIYSCCPQQVRDEMFKLRVMVKLVIPALSKAETGSSEVPVHLGKLVKACLKNKINFKKSGCLKLSGRSCLVSFPSTEEKKKKWLQFKKDLSPVCAS